VPDLLAAAEVKRYLGVEHSDDDTLIGEVIAQVNAAVEAYTGKAFATQTDRIDYVNGGGECLILLSPISAIGSVKDHFNADELIAGTDYEFDPKAGLVYFKPDALAASLGELGGKWGAGRRRWKVTYTCGYGSYPADVKAAALTWIADIYAHRDAASSERLGDQSVTRDAIPERVKQMLAPYRVTAL